MVLEFCLLTIGLFGLWAGAELLVKNSSQLAQAMGVSPIIVGLTVVSLGTSIPELVVCIIAAVKGDMGIAIGNIVGSNIANLGLILGVGAMLIPLEIKASWIKREVPYMILVTFFFTVFAYTDTTISTAEGLALFGFLMLFLFYLGRFTLREMTEFKELEQSAKKAEIRQAPLKKKLISLLLSLTGIGILIVGSELSVTSGTNLANLIGVSESIIGLTLIAFGTSLPELATTVVSAMRREVDLAVGNIIGSNIFNLVLIGGVTALIRPIPLEPKLLQIEFPLFLCLSILIWPMMRFNWNVHRYEGVALISIYTVFIFLTFGG